MQLAVKWMVVVTWMTLLGCSESGAVAGATAPAATAELAALAPDKPLPLPAGSTIGIKSVTPAARPSEPAKDAPTPADTYLTPLRRIEGTPFFIQQLTLSGMPGLFSKMKGPDWIRNVMFIDAESGKRWWLHKTSDQFVLNLRVLLPEGYNEVTGEGGRLTNIPGAGTPAAAAAQQALIQANRAQLLLYLAVPTDTNGDGLRDAGDLKTLALSKVDGSAYTEVLKNIKMTNGVHALPGQNRLLIAYRTANEDRLAVLELSSFKIVSDDAVRGP